nr:MAG TPA: hypothetical protein [Caudoviricetes sp.]
MCIFTISEYLWKSATVYTSYSILPIYSSIITKSI